MSSPAVRGRSWSELRGELVEAFEAFPFERDADTIEAAFRAHPVATRRACERVISRKQSGKVRDGWRVLALEVGGRRPASGSSPVEEEGELELLERRLRAWVANEGRHYDPQTFADELERKLRHTVDVGIRARLADAYAQTRPPHPAEERRSPVASSPVDSGGPSPGTSLSQEVVA